MASCEICYKEHATPLWQRGYYGTVVKNGLKLKCDVAICDTCWRVVSWTLRRVWDKQK